MSLGGDTVQSSVPPFGRKSPEQVSSSAQDNASWLGGSFSHSLELEIQGQVPARPGSGASPLPGCSRPSCCAHASWKGWEALGTPIPSRGSRLVTSSSPRGPTS